MPRALPDLARRTVTLNTGRRSIDIPVDGSNHFRRAGVVDLRILRDAVSDVDDIDPDGGAESGSGTDDDSVTSTRFSGHAIKYDSPTWIGSQRWGFWETIESGACTKTIREKRGENNDITFNRDHDNRLLFARTSNGTLRLTEDGVGLLADADMGPYSYTEDAIAAVLRRDLTGMSFAFDAITYEWSIAPDGNELLTHREIELYDVSVVGMPAYADTDTEMRLDLLAVARSAGFDDGAFAHLARRLADPDPELIAALRDLSRSAEDLAPGRSTPDVQGAPAETTRTTLHPLAVAALRQQAEQIERSMT